LALWIGLAGLGAAADPFVGLRQKAAQLEERIAGLNPDLAPDVEVYLKAVRWALRFPEELYSPQYVENGGLLLERGLSRATELAAGKPSWPAAKGRLSRGYRSKVDGSIQPYGLVIPDSYDPGRPTRLDVWLHGRGATLTEISFLAAHDSLEPVPPGQDFIQLDVFGRGNNAYRWAGETDVFEALESVRGHYNIDPDRIVLRGFSMGGAGAWHIGLHYPSRWAAVEAGAGFTETIRYAKLQRLTPEQSAALRIYDAANYAPNAWNVPIVGYGGENDPQLQASTNIREVLERQGMLAALRALFLVGPQTAHKWHAGSKKQSDEFIASVLPRRKPERIRFVTFTPRYGECFGLRVEALERTYERAEIDVQGTEIRTVNVSQLALPSRMKLTIDGRKVDGQWFEKRRNRWYNRPGKGLRKRAGLQGPIDDAFLDPFIVVPPNTSSPELDRCAREYAKWMRGDVRIRKAAEVTARDIEDYHLVLFGTPRDNPLIAKIAADLPLNSKNRWISGGNVSFRAAGLILKLIYPNPLNPRRYVVLNSLHTFGDAEFKGTNALLFPRLGDYALVDDYTGEVRCAGFFDEKWQLPSDLCGSR
jgi:hypothetical protein